MPKTRGRRNLRRRRMTRRKHVGGDPVPKSEPSIAVSGPVVHPTKPASNNLLSINKPQVWHNAALNQLFAPRNKRLERAKGANRNLIWGNAMKTLPAAAPAAQPWYKFWKG